MKAEGAIRTFEGMLRRKDRSHILAEATFPVLLIAGAEDTVVPPELAFTVKNKNKTDTTYIYQ